MTRATKNSGEFTERVDVLLELLAEARNHVFRQQFHGRHEQDRADAVELLPKIEDALKK